MNSRSLRGIVPTSIAALSVVSSPDAGCGDDSDSVHRYRAGFLISARLEKMKWTRIKTDQLASIEKCCQSYLHLSESSRPLSVLTDGLIRTATVSGIWQSLASGLLHLSSRVQSPDARPAKSRPKRPGDGTVDDCLILTPSCKVISCTTGDGSRITFSDIANYYPQPAEELGRLCRLRWPTLPHADCPDSDFLDCAEQRAIIIYRLITRLINWWLTVRPGPWQSTIAGLALSAYRSTCSSHGHDSLCDQDARDFARLACYPGLREARWVGEIRSGNYHQHPHAIYNRRMFDAAPRGVVHLIDAASFYGGLHASHDLPCALTAEGDSLSIDDARKLIVDDSFIATVLVNSLSERFPTRITGKFEYALGNYATTLCGPELLRAVQSGAVLKVGKWYRYRLAPMLADFTRRFWQHRLRAAENDDLPIESICKSLIARLHGKFAQRSTRWDLAPDVAALTDWGVWSHYSSTDQVRYDYRAIAGVVQRKVEAADPRYSYPAITAWTTAQGRETLRMASHVAGPGTVLYVATDSMIVTDLGRERLEIAGLINDDEIGLFRIKESSDSIIIRGGSCMQFAGRLWLTGISRPANEAQLGSVSSEQGYGLAGVIASRGAPEWRVRVCEITPGWYYPADRTDDYGWISPIIINEGSKKCLTNDYQDKNWID